MIDASPFWALFSIGLLGSGHCLGMCGGLTAAFSLSMESSNQGSRLLKLCGYQIGRISSYMLIALLFGYSLEALSNWLQIKPMLNGLRTFANLMLIAMGLYIARWWVGLQWLEKKGAIVWRHIQPLTQKLVPVRHVSQSLALGLIWGWLPCGLVYSALITSASYAQGQLSALYMLGFGLGTLPSMLLTGLAADKIKSILATSLFRQAAGMSIIFYAMSQLLLPLSQTL